MTSTAAPRAREIDQRLADRRGRAGIDAPGRLADDQHAAARAGSRGRRRISADCRRRGCAASGSRLALRTSKALVTRSTYASVAPRVDEAVLHHARSAAWPVSSDVLATASCAAPSPWPRRSSGTKAAPSRRRSVIAEPTGGAAVDDDGMLGAPAQPFAGQRGEQFVLPVAGDTGDAEDLAAAHLERDVRRAARRCGSSGASRELVARRAAARRACAPVRALHLADLGADHHAGQRRARSPRADRRSRPPCRRAGSSRCRRARFTSSSLWVM